MEQSEELARMKEELDNEINKHDNRMHRYLLTLGTVCLMTDYIQWNL